MVAAVQRRDRALAGRLEAVRAGGGDAREHGEPERAAHHERGVDDAGGEARLGRGNAAHRREQERVEPDPGAEADRERRGQDVDEEVPVDRRPDE